jgi:hypothetical protein
MSYINKERKNMSDIAIQPSGIPEYRGTGKIVPCYLVSIESGKKDMQFIATKFDDNFMHCAKFVGFYTTATTDSITTKYEELIKTAETNNFIEVLIPWNRIISIRSLIYKHKTK